MGSLKLYLIIGLLLAGILGSVYLYWSYSQNKIQELTANNAKLVSTNETQTKTIKTLQKNFKDTQKNLDNLNKKYSKISSKTNTNRESFNLGTIDSTNKIEIITKFNKNYNDIIQNLVLESQNLSEGK